MATFVAFAFRFNKIAIYAGTFINNPFITLVPIIILSYAVGALIMGRPMRIPEEGVQLLKNPEILSGEYYRQVFVQSWNLVEPFTIGASVLSVVCSLLAYPITLKALRAYGKRKIKKAT
jgi:uncharacterized protein (DUF2062 family)